MIPGISHVGLIHYQRELYKFFQTHPEYKVVHSHQNELSGMILKQAKRAGVLARFAHAHIVFTPKNIFNEFEWWFFQRFFPNNVTRAFACSIEAGKSLYIGKLKEKIEFIPNVIDTNQIQYNQAKRQRIRRELHIENEFVVGHVGRFAQQKNHSFLIDIFAEIIKINKDAKLILIGNGSLKDKVLEKTKKKGIDDHVLFLGNRSDVPDCLSAMDIFLFPSLYEGLSVACVEAQAAGLPVLTSTSVSDEIAITELVTQFPLSENARKWAEQALQMGLYTKIDRAMYAEKVKVAGFDAKVLAKKMQNIYLRAYDD